MIDEIHVQNLALIADASIEPSSGLTVLTGETGAGKTALLTSCKLLMGARGERSCVREGTDEACVQGRFFIDGDAEYVVVRRVSADGKSRVQLNGQMVSVGELADALAASIDLCSQHDSQELLKASTHLRLLDAWAGNEGLVSAYAQAYQHYSECFAHLEEIRAGGKASAEQLEQATFVLRQIDAVSPDVGEYEELIAALSKAENAEALARAASVAREALSGDDGALTYLGQAVSSLDDGARHDETLAKFADTLRESVYIIEDVARDVAAYVDGIEFEQDALDRMQQRIAAYQGLMRAYGPTVADVVAKADEAREKISMFDNSESLELEAVASLEQANAALEQAALALSKSRQQVAIDFASKIVDVMANLEMGSAGVECQVTLLPRNQWTMSGADKVELAFRPAHNMQARPLSRIASGGELSRVLLALHVVMEDKDEVSTLVFDEIDAGVGGATANALADVLVQLSCTHQVLVVTHLAQVAARADKHYVVRKYEREGVAETDIQLVCGPDREREIARMLSGSVTDTSIAHAQELLQHISN
ncbi:DNA repair protein RecN [Adlercreutzia sp. ZJ304]|uniref:DNA repair protein RecN n=1 Tax=Adlercreutzia sp. ZJ304 TaxID=2709791 RepID=UPI0013EB60F1|nr:DNA repair protein RecN [Adlercreutzia sp. ZJ304]